MPFRGGGSQKLSYAVRERKTNIGLPKLLRQMLALRSDQYRYWRYWFQYWYQYHLLGYWLHIHWYQQNIHYSLLEKYILSPKYWFNNNIDIGCKYRYQLDYYINKCLLDFRSKTHFFKDFGAGQHRMEFCDTLDLILGQTVYNTSLFWDRIHLSWYQCQKQTIVICFSGQVETAYAKTYIK